jgi:hypothetical protein
MHIIFFDGSNASTFEGLLIGKEPCRGRSPARELKPENIFLKTSQKKD